MSGDEDEEDGADQTICEGFGVWAFGDAFVYGMPASSADGIAGPEKHMQDGFENGDPCKPAMKEVESVVRNFKHPNERVVSKCKEDCWNDVECCQCSCATAEGCHDFFDGAIIRNG